MAIEYSITPERVRQLFDYIPATGCLIWRSRTGDSGAIKAWNTKYASRLAGSIGTGTMVVRINREGYPLHHVVWAWMTGAWPRISVDHKNRDWKDNRWSNLREATPAQQAQNRRRTTTLPKGVRRSRNGYIAVLGLFATPQEAHAAWLISAKVVHGEFFSAE